MSHTTHRILSLLRLNAHGRNKIRHTNGVIIPKNDTIQNDFILQSTSSTPHTTLSIALSIMEAMPGGLGKRCHNDAFQDHVPMDWIPGAFVQCDPCGDHAELSRLSKAHLNRTSLLFAELEREVRAEREATWLARRARNFRDLRISAELAARFPMRTDDDEEKEDTHREDTVEGALRPEQPVAQPYAVKPQQLCY